MPTPHQIPKGFIEVRIRYSPVATEFKHILLAISNIAKVSGRDQESDYSVITLYSKLDNGQNEVLTVEGDYEQTVSEIKRQVIVI